MESNFLRSTLAGESRAYGFTLAFWGSGALLLGAFGIPSFLEVMLYTSGAIVGFALVTLLAFKEPFETVGQEESEYMVFSMVHFISSLAPIAVTFALTEFSSHRAVYFLSGASVSMNYNLLMILEKEFIEHVSMIERKLKSHSSTSDHSPP